jgi:outer membrane protein OmpA-like peptidoglycan-associated protein
MMRRSSPILFVTLAALMLVAAPAAAQVGSGSRGVDAQVFKPAVDGYGLFSVDRPETAKQFEFGFKFFFDFASTPLRLQVPSQAGGTDLSRRAMIDYQVAFNLQAYMGLLDRLELFLDFPIARQKLGTAFGSKAGGTPTGFYAVDPASNVSPPAAAPLDTRLGLKYRILSKSGFSLGAQFLVSVPFGEESEFMGEKSFTYQPKLLAAARFGNFSVALNVGAILRQEFERIYDPYALASAPHPVLGVGHEMTVAAGAVYRLNRFVAFGVEGFSGIPINKVKDEGFTFKRDTYADIVGGFLFYPTGELAISLGGGGGVITDSARRDTFRVFAGISWSPEAIEKAKGDRDGDGIPDDQDACPDEPEDFDGYQDEDGCPDPDNDGDGIPDIADKCPNDAEDKDSFQDEDGCPDADNDGDGIPDVKDKCPNEPEDVDGYQDEDGCRDDDNDGDGIPDKDDKCPNEPETYNSYEDDDGCPDQLPQELGPKPGEPLKIGRVDFKGATATIDKKALPLLDRLASDLKKWVNLRLRIEGHTDDKGKPDKLLKLSRDRAESVRQYLVSKGIDPNRLIAEGYGSRRPLQSNATAAGRAANQRIEFIPIEK